MRAVHFGGGAPWRSIRASVRARRTEFSWKPVRGLPSCSRFLAAKFGAGVASFRRSWELRIRQFRDERAPERPSLRTLPYPGDHTPPYESRVVFVEISVAIDMAGTLSSLGLVLWGILLWCGASSVAARTPG